jgi:hypothetical protein
VVYSTASKPRARYTARLAPVVVTLLVRGVNGHGQKRGERRLGWERKKCGHPSWRPRPECPLPEQA